MTDASPDGVDAPDDSSLQVGESPPNDQADNLNPADGKLAAEAARYRVAARAAETELVVAQARIAELQRAEIDRHLATKVALPADFWLATDVTVADLLNDDGTGIDIDKVDAAADAVLQGRDHWRAKLGPVGAPASAVNSDGKIPSGPQTPSWEDVFKGKAG